MEGTIRLWYNIYKAIVPINTGTTGMEQDFTLVGGLALFYLR